MSTCPENDIHSIYLDGELPEIYKAEYEAHLNNCIKCRTKLEQMKKIHEAFQYDSASNLWTKALNDFRAECATLRLFLKIRTVIQ